VEAKILTTDGELDLPRDLGGADLVYAADHQWPTPWGPVHPREVRAEIEAGTTRPATLLGWLVHGICGALRRHAGSVVLAHPFSILPKAGLSEDDLTEQQLAQVALSARWSWAVVEISERWNCPGRRALAAFREHQVAMVLSTDAHRPGDIGRYHRALELFQARAGARAAA
jgi:putative hydrolase